MSASLSETDVEGYWRDGYISRIPVLTPDEAAGYFTRLEAIEAEEIAKRGGPWEDRSYRPWDMDDHPLFEMANELVHHPALLDAVEAILGPDILIRNADFFLKEPKVRRGIGWHQDTAETGPTVDGMMTAWLGLTASTQANGCLRFSAGSHRLEIPGGPKDKYTLTFTKEAASHLAPEATVHNEMEPGMASLHHIRTAHSSGPNLSRARRLGFVVRFMTPDVTPETAESGSATLVRGSGARGRFALKDRFPMTWTG